MSEEKPIYDAEKSSRDVGVIDWSLQDLVVLANKTDITMGLTLTVGGTLISGNLISGAQFFSKLSERLQSSAGNKTIGSGLSKLFDNISKDRYNSEVIDATEVVFIHLEDAKHLVGDRFVPDAGTLWRGKLCDVSGFSIGSLKPADTN